MDYTCNPNFLLRLLELINYISNIVHEFQITILPVEHIVL